MKLLIHLFRGSSILISTTALLFAVWLTATHAQSEPPPSGFEWIKFPEIGAFFLKPIHWQSGIRQGKLMSSLVLHEDTGTDTSPRITVNVVPNLTKMKYQLVSRQIDDISQSYDNSNNLTVINKEPVNFGVYSGVSITLEEKPKLLDSLSFQRIYLANDQKDWLLVIEFRCLTEDWVSLGNIRTGVLSSMVF